MRQSKSLTEFCGVGAINTKEGAGKFYQLAGGACLVRSARLMHESPKSMSYSHHSAWMYVGITIRLCHNIVSTHHCLCSEQPATKLAGMWLRMQMSCALCCAERSGQGHDQAHLSLRHAVIFRLFHYALLARLAVCHD